MCSVHEQEGIATPALLLVPPYYIMKGEWEEVRSGSLKCKSNHACSMNSQRFIVTIARLSVLVGSKSGNVVIEPEVILYM